jgi:hypothetical protein
LKSALVYSDLSGDIGKLGVFVGIQ